MPNSITLLGQQLKEIWKHFGINQKISTIMGLVVLLAGIAALVWWSSRPDYQLLYAGLSLQDAAAAREKLSDEQIPYQIKDSGRAIFVPFNDVYRARLLLAAEGLPKDTATGFEMLEERKFGLTDFAQQVNYQRALQGELERTIAAMNGIESARVLLVLPRDKLFATETEKKATASIMLRLGGGVTLTAGQVQSIAQLGGSSVPGLDPNGITITDQNGQLLTKRAGAAEDQAGQANDQLALQEKVEAQLTKKAQDMLDTALGAGRSIVRVSARLDFSKVERRRENYDAENRVVKNEYIQTESSRSPAGTAGGVAGVVANVPVGSPASGTVEAEMATVKKENIRTEYAIPNAVEHVVESGGRLANLSVSVCVAKGAQPRAAEELKKIEQMVRGCVGLVENETRRDLIDVTEMEFAPEAPAVRMPWGQALPIRLDTLGRALLAALLVYIIYRASRRVVTGLVVRREDAGVPIQSLTGEYGEGGAAGTGRQLEGEGGLPLDPNLEEIARIAEQNPKVIAAWISSVAKPGA